MNEFTIKDIENLSGIKAHTIRIWEQRYNFIKPHRSQTNIRYYSNEELKTILNVSLLTRFGYKISHINKMDPETIEETIGKLSIPDAKHERLINQLISDLIAMDVEQFENKLGDFIASNNIIKAIELIIFPFLERIGMLWMSNRIRPAQEHLAFNILRQKLIAGIETIEQPDGNARKVLLFLPENEFHELGILYTYYQLKLRGIKCIYVGASVPINDVEFIVQRKKVDCIHTHLTAVANNFNFEKFLKLLNQKVGFLPVLVSGQLTLNYKKAIPPNIIFVKSLQEVGTFIDGI